MSESLLPDRRPLRLIVIYGLDRSHVEVALQHGIIILVNGQRP